MIALVIILIVISVVSIISMLLYKISYFAALYYMIKHDVPVDKNMLDDEIHEIVHDKLIETIFL